MTSLLDSCALQIARIASFACGFIIIGNQDMSCILAIDRNMHNRSNMMALTILSMPRRVHQLAVSCSNLLRRLRLR